MKNTCLMAVVALLIVSAACKKENKSEQLAALESAYQSGVLSKSEYEAKRLALTGQPPPVAAPSAPAANPVVQPQNPPLAAPPTPAVEVPQGLEPSAASGAPRMAQKKPTPFVTQPRATKPSPFPQTAVQPEPIAQPPAAPPVRVPEPPAAPTSSVPKNRATDETEPQPLAGCEDEEYQSGRVKGERQRFYEAPPDSVKKAARAALESLDFDIHKDAGNEMEASKRRHIGVIVGAGGERLILQFKKTQQGNQKGTLVTGETKKSFVGRLAQKSWTNAVLAQIACHLKSGR